MQTTGCFVDLVTSHVIKLIKSLIMNQIKIKSCHVIKLIYNIAKTIIAKTIKLIHFSTLWHTCSRSGLCKSARCQMVKFSGDLLSSRNINNFFNLILFLISSSKDKSITLRFQQRKSTTLLSNKKDDYITKILI